MNKSLSYVNLSLELHVVSTFWLWSDTSGTFSLHLFCPAIIQSYELERPALENAHALVQRTDIFSSKFSIKVSLMLGNPFLVLSVCKVNHISLYFIQISTKSPAKLLIPFRESTVSLKSSPVFWASVQLAMHGSCMASHAQPLKSLPKLTFMFKARSLTVLC